MPTIVNIFTGVANTSRYFYWVGVGGGQNLWGAMMWWAKAMFTLKTAKWHPFVPFSLSHIIQNN